MSPPAGGPAHRSGYVAIAGVPNVGKSTLLNALVGTRLSIISPKPQTTRQNLIGILTGEDFQMILVDTPGLLDPSYRLQSAMLQHARSAIEGADALLLLLDAGRVVERDPGPDLEAALRIAGADTPVVLALNKVDRVAKPQLLPLIEQCAALHPFRALIPISALEADGLEPLVTELVRLLPEGPRLYPEDTLSDQPERFFVAELVREAVFHRFGQEIPYATVTRVEEFRRTPGKKTYISVNIFVERSSQKGILVGKGGHAIREVGTRARQAVQEMLSEEVYLDLHVKVLEEWRTREERLRELGLL